MSGHVGDAPRLLGGDFNVTLLPEESSSFDSSQSFTVDMKNFQALVKEIKVFDHAYFGLVFTWSNNQLDRPIAKKLHRVLIKVAWLQFLPHSRVEFAAPNCSNHCPFIVWFLQLIAESWQPTVVGDPMLNLLTKLKRLKLVLKMLNTEAFDNIFARVKAKAKKLESLKLVLLQGDLVRSGHIDKWIREGDQSTKFFHSTVTVKRNKHTVTSLFDATSNRLESFDQISVEILGFYQNFLGAVDSNVVECPNFLLQKLLPKFSNDIHRVLTSPITNEEINATIFGQGNEKAPSSNSFAAFFFKSAWGIVGLDFLEVVQYSFASSTLLASFNATSISFVPKCDNLSYVKDFWPISCCSVVYKCITKPIGVANF
ncbi:hypothetical protein V6Z11_A05G464200 [Gossypium hirsutum]